jgi:flagellar hook protein FlgE
MGIGNIANTGMRAAMTDMEIISNNIANANTIGYKRSYGTFGDIYPNSNGGATTQAGLGVALNSIHQDFTRGGALYTSNPLDLMINSGGFFVTKDSTSGATSYTRAGRFTLDNEGYINNGKQRLQGFPAVNGVVSAGGNLDDLQISSAPRNATATSTVSENLNLNSTGAVITAPFNKDDSTTYNYMTTKTIFDSLGNSHSLSLYFAKSADNTWTANALVDNNSVGTGNVTFNTDGSLNSVTGLNALTFVPGTGAVSPQTINVSLSASSQYASDNTTRALSQNGYPVGNLNGYEVDNDGNVIGSYSNQERVLLGKVAVAQFQSPDGLASIGNMSWLETGESGRPIINPGNSNKNISSSVVETSNVDLTQEMISLIGAQHNFQANAQVEQTYNEVMKTVIQI